MEIDLQKGSGPRDEGEGEGNEKELRCIMYVCKRAMKDVIIVHFKHVLI